MAALRLEIIWEEGERTHGSWPRSGERTQGSVRIAIDGVEVASWESSGDVETDLSRAVGYILWQRKQKEEAK